MKTYLKTLGRAFKRHFARFLSLIMIVLVCIGFISGIGMSAEHVQHIFERFYQIDVHHAGSGIGLALVKAFVEMHHGHIQVESGEKKGTAFTIEIPMKQAGTLAEGLERNAVLTNLKEGAVLDADLETIRRNTETVMSGNKETILVIDDNQDVRNYVKLLLQTQYTVIEAADGQEGIKQAMKYVPDAIICDVMMPIMDGMECCRRLKSEIQTSHIPIMMLTAYAMDEQKIQGYECGADSYITKPFSLMVLVSKVHAFMRRADSAPKAVIRSGNIAVSYTEMKAYRTPGQEEIPLSRKELQLLVYFMENSRQILSKEQILAHVWDVDGQFVDDNTVPVNISRLKGKLGESYIQNVRGIGYIWTEESFR